MREAMGPYDNVEARQASLSRLANMERSGTASEKLGLGRRGGGHVYL